MASVFFTACYDSDDISSELGDINAEVPMDSSNPVDHYIYEFYTKYKSVILYDYEEPFYNWDFNTIKGLEHHLQTDKEVLAKALDYSEEVFFDIYDDEFKKKYFPLRILLSDSINKPGDGLKDILSESSTAYVSIGSIRNEYLDALTDDKRLAAKTAINKSLWLGYIKMNNYYEIPESFKDLGRQYINVNLKTLPENEDTDVDMCKYGFWVNRNGDQISGNGWSPQDYEDDFVTFLEFIISNKKSDLQDRLNENALLNEKYEIVIDYIKLTFDFDLQSIAGE
jgi:hypothetical protein